MKNKPELYSWQKEYLEAIKSDKRMVVMQSRQHGKTYFSQVIAEAVKHDKNNKG